MRLFAAIFTALLLSLSFAHAKAGDPIPGVPIGLEGDPYNIVILQSTDGKGNAAFARLAPGRYTVFMPDTSRLEGPVQISVSTDGSAPKSKSFTIQPGRERAYALDEKGQKLVVTIAREGGRISVAVWSIFDRWGNHARPATK